jgi:hypothetical protein
VDFVGLSLNSEAVAIDRETSPFKPAALLAGSVAAHSL